MTNEAKYKRITFEQCSIHLVGTRAPVDGTTDCRNIPGAKEQCPLLKIKDYLTDTATEEQIAAAALKFDHSINVDKHLALEKPGGREEIDIHCNASIESIETVMHKKPEGTLNGELFANPVSVVPGKLVFQRIHVSEG